MNPIENTRRVKPVELVMVLEDLSGPACFPLPPGYSYRGFRQGDEELWVRIETSAGEFASADGANQHFRREFGQHQLELCDRCLFVERENGEPVGTAMAWYGTLLPGGAAGRLHWLGIRKEYQGRGIGKPLVSQAMKLLSSRHDRAYLTTHSKSLAAIKIYLDFGFLPYIREEIERKEWVEIAKHLGMTDMEIGSNF
jgi:ribosomal protein S18 acetylase RimI-like enzyme